MDVFSSVSLLISSVCAYVFSTSALLDYMPNTIAHRFGLLTIPGTRPRHSSSSCLMRTPWLCPYLLFLPLPAGAQVDIFHALAVPRHLNLTTGCSSQGQLGTDHCSGADILPCLLDSTGAVLHTFLRKRPDNGGLLGVLLIGSLSSLGRFLGCGPFFARSVPYR